MNSTHSAAVDLSVAESFQLNSQKQGVEAIEDIQAQLNQHLTHYKDLYGDSEKTVELDISNKTKQQNVNKNDDNDDSD